MIKVNRFIKKREKKIGLPPGTPVYTGEKKKGGIEISVIDYDKQQFRKKEYEKIEDCFDYKDTSTVSWINIDGVHQAEIIEKLGQFFKLHPLVVEDIMSPGHRPKMEEFEDYIFIVLKMLSYDKKEKRVKEEQVSLILGLNYVISFQERQGDVFNPIRERIKKGRGRIRKMGPDYLMHSLLDAVVDNYFLILEEIGEEIEELEEKLIDNSRPDTLQKIHSLKREMIFLRRSVWPLREVISGLQKSASDLIRRDTIRFLQDINDHTIQVMDTIEIFRDMLFSMHDTYLSNISNRMNEVMKVLTMIATIFIPLTFLAGVYGMNFKFMPELSWRGGYFIVLGIMAAIVIFMVIYFKKKKWL